ncbi:LexA/Signal peptidase [Lentinula detonsa]|uniref:LexA/Signal peptidase n=1 Tax=Lentinula detonsa TaxID=2804962 RepID=A0AA38UXQ0_9AGAR|nr:LexA/Signal peptidase [Lentinula detonsa]
MRRTLEWVGNTVKHAIAKIKSPYVVTKRIGIAGLKLVNLACATHLFLEYVGTVSLMSGPSMLPTLASSGEVVVEDKLSLRLNPTSLARGDLVVVRSPINPTLIVCKRVIGLPGDVVCVDPTGLKAPSTEHVIVPKGHIWLCGDNMLYSRDSRDYGPVPMALIRSKLVARIWPLKDSTIFRNPMRVLD